MDDNKDSEGFSRRDFLKTAAVATHALVFPNKIPLREKRDNHSSQTPDNKDALIDGLVAEIENLSLKELQEAVYETYPVIPDIDSIRENLANITTISSKSNLMLAGTSVALGMFESIDPSKVDIGQVDLGDEQYKFELIQQYFDISAGSINSGGIQMGGDMNDLIEGTVEQAIKVYEPQVAINFVGTNLVRFDNVTLEEFARQTDAYINQYLDHGVIPILTTFPTPSNATDPEYVRWFNEPVPIARPNKTEEEVIQEEIEFRHALLPENALKYNLLLLKMAEAYKIPIINIERGLEELAVSNGDVTVEQNNFELDPNHISTPPEPTPLKLPPEGQKFEYGEQAVSYFTIQTLYGILDSQNQSS